MNITTIKQVKRFETSDGRTHESELAAVSAQQEIDVRAILQRDERIGKSTQCSLVEAGKAIVTNIEELQKVAAAYKAKLNRIRKRTTPAA